MNLISAFKNIAGSLLGFNNAALVETEPAMRASFLDTVRAFNDEYGEIDPGFPIELIDTISKLALINPDVSQTIQKITALGNVGHSLDIEGSQRAAKYAAEELDILARKAFPSKAGADGFINQQFRQICVTGALCQEVVPSMGLNEVEQVYQVRASSIRFRLEDNRFAPLQQVGIKKIMLNPETFSYIPLMTDEDSPYAIPPFISPLRMLLRQEKQWENIDDFMDLWGVMGLTWMTVNMRKNFNEIDDEYQKRAERLFTKIYNSFKNHMKKGIAITDRDTDLKHHNVSKNAGQVDKLIEATEQQIASGLDIDPAMLGRTYSTTETYATVCYETLLGKIGNIQRIIKRANEGTYNFHLVMRRIPAVCSMQFKDAPSLKRKEEMETRQIEQSMIFERMDRGIIDEDTAARELGYEKAYRKIEYKNKEALGRFRFDYDRNLKRYVFTRPRIALTPALYRRAREQLAEKKTGMNASLN